MVKAETVEKFLHIPTKKQLGKMLLGMVMSEELDRMQRIMHNTTPQSSFFQIYGAGHEALGVALGIQMKPGDSLFSYYRDTALNIMLGVTAKDILLGAAGSPEDPQSGGRQFAQHFGWRKKSIMIGASPIAIQFLPAVGFALGGRIAEMTGITQRILNYATDEVVVVCGGDGSFSQGESFEAINLAALDKLPVLVVVEDDEYAISVPLQQQTAGGSISKILAGFNQPDKDGKPLMKIWQVDGCDVFESFRICGEVFDYIRKERKPGLIHAKVVRHLGHSGSDNRRRYMTLKQQEEEIKKLPIPRFKKALIEKGFFIQEELERRQQKIRRIVERARDYAVQAEKPKKEYVSRYVLEESRPAEAPQLMVRKSETKEKYKLWQALNKTLHQEMARDQRVICFGEDVADGNPADLVAWDEKKAPWSLETRALHEEIENALKQGKVYGKGGVFNITTDLQKRFGPYRCFNTPLAEATIVGAAIGLAGRGLKPVPEIQFIDYIYPAMEQIWNNLSTIRWRSNNDWWVPVVIRATHGAYLQGSGAMCHSQCAEGLFAHKPGIYVILPSTVSDAVGLLKTAIRHCNDPVLFLEEKILYKQPELEEPLPGPDYTVPFGKARIDIPLDQNVRGAKLTLVTYGTTRFIANRVIKKHFPGRVELIDLRTIAPWDKETVFASVQKTGRVLVLHTDNKTMGFGAEIVAEIVDSCFEYLDLPPQRLAGLDMPVPYHPDNERWVLPQEEDIARKIEELLSN